MSRSRWAAIAVAAAASAFSRLGVGLGVPACRSLAACLQLRLAPALTDGYQKHVGNLTISPAEHDEVMADPVAAKYVRRFVGATELIHNKDRWCLWLTELDPADVPRSPVLRKRLEAVKSVRLASKNPETWPHAETPHLFWFISQPAVPYLCIPAHFSENRRYATVARFEPNVIAGNANFT